MTDTVEAVFISGSGNKQLNAVIQLPENLNTLIFDTRLSFYWNIVHSGNAAVFQANGTNSRFDIYNLEFKSSSSSGSGNLLLFCGNTQGLGDNSITVSFVNFKTGGNGTYAENLYLVCPTRFGTGGNDFCYITLNNCYIQFIPGTGNIAYNCSAESNLTIKNSHIVNCPRIIRGSDTIIANSTICFYFSATVIAASISISEANLTISDSYIISDFGSETIAISGIGTTGQYKLKILNSIICRSSTSYAPIYIGGGVYGQFTNSVLVGKSPQVSTESATEYSCNVTKETYSSNKLYYLE